MKNVRGMCRTGSFKLTRFVSNCKELLMSIPQKDRRQEAPDKRLLEAVLDYALGVLWNIEEDKLEFQVHMKEKLLPRTGMLSSLSLIYDPLGFAALVMLERRRIIQTLCHQNLHWDEQNPEGGYCKAMCNMEI